jgi:hypothetical protein
MPSAAGLARIAGSLALAVALLAPRAAATPAPDLTSRLTVDGFSADFASDERLFGVNEGTLEEGTADSKWGVNNDLYQIHVTWDANYLYVAADAIIWDNNVILLFDVTEGNPGDPDDDGLASMTQIDSWRRNFDFGNGFTPDLFIATWDRNPTPRLLVVKGPTDVEEQPFNSYAAVSTFSQSSRDRAMEAAIPWPIILGADAERVYVASVGDTLYRIPDRIHELRIAGVITAGPDGTGGPDSAPDNLQGHTMDSANKVLIDNYARLPLDEDGDGFPDFGISIKERTTFLVQPPVRGITFEIGELDLARAVVSPEENRPLEFGVSLSPAVPPGEEEFRRVSLTAEIFDLQGRRVRVLYRNDERLASTPENAVKDVWDGRDEGGRPVRGGIYILQVVSEPGLNRNARAFSVVR